MKKIVLAALVVAVAASFGFCSNFCESSCRELSYAMCGPSHPVSCDEIIEDVKKLH